MSSVCISNCVDDAKPFQATRANYVSLQKLLEVESDAEFVKSAAAAAKVGRRQFVQEARVVDSVSCRQLYIRSAYTFTREETMQERTKKCFGRVKMTCVRLKKRSRPRIRRRRALMLMMKRVKDSSCAALRSVFHRLLSGTATVDVVEQPRA